MAGSPSVAVGVAGAGQSATTATGVRVGVRLPVHLVADAAEYRVGVLRAVTHCDTVTPMRNIRIDSSGSPRCYNCGSKGLTEKRTLRSKALIGVGALLTKKKLKCQRCGEYNDAGNGQPYTGPAARKYRKEWELEQAG
jgi:DNA-directed RNA polymerase subunit RPC12/RpoP